MKLERSRHQWYPQNLARLEAMLEHARPGQYAVVDWDNTSIFRDIQDVVLDHQCEKMAFRIAPDALAETLLDGLPEQAFAPDCRNLDGERVRAAQLAADLEADYRWAHENPALVRQSHPRMLAFRARLRFFYHALDRHLGHILSCTWITRLYAGMTAPQVHRLTHEAIQAASHRAIARARWEMPEGCAGESGRVAVTWSQGARALVAMQELYGALEARGVNVHVVSASFGEIVREFASNEAHGYHLSADRVHGMQLERGADGRFTHRMREDVSHTQAEGKTRTIEAEIKPLYGGEPPLFMAGDSNGDAPMLDAFEGVEVRLILNRAMGGHIGALSRRCEQDPSILLQGRDEPGGVLRPSRASIMLGVDGERLYKEPVDKVA